MNNFYKKSKGNAGLDGVQFQIGLTTVVLLNALRNLKDWRMSTENKDAGKFDDVVIELSDGTAVMVQVKHKDSRRINRDQLLSDNPKNSHFCLPKYFLSYQEIKCRFKVRNIIICTNADVDKEKLKDIVVVQHNSSDSILYFQEESFFIKFNENIVADLRRHSESYYDKNWQGKGVDKDVISDGNLQDFLDKLQFFTNYPSQEHLHKLIDRLLYRSTDGQLWSGISSRELYEKVEDWFKQEGGECLTESHARAMFCRIKSEQFGKALKKYKASFADTELSFNEGKGIYHVNVGNGYLLEVLKTFHALRDRETLFVSPNESAEVYREMVEAFGLPKYEFLVLIIPKTINQDLMLDICVKLKEVLNKYTYKKVVLISNKGNIEQSVLKDDIVEIDISATFNNLTQQSREELIRKEIVNYQGNNISLENLLGVSTIKGFALDSEELEKLVKEEEITVGKTVARLDPNIARYYINRKFERGIEKEKDGIIIPLEKQKETFTQKSILDVKEKLIIISDCAGMGKSTILVQLATNMKDKYPHLWVIRIELNEYTRILRESRRRNECTINIIELLDSSEATRISRPLEKFVFSMNQKVVVMLDGFDEISPDYTELVLSLLEQCQNAPNIAKVFITTRPHMNSELEEILKVKPFLMQPFTTTDQIEFLVNYWGHNLKLNESYKDKCEKYAVILINKMSSWMKTKPHFMAIPLQVRMLAEIFQNDLEDGVTEWENCKEFLEGDKGEPELPEKVKITVLYAKLIKMKLDVFLDKVNPSGNVAVNDLHESQFDRYFVNHQSLALNEILHEEAIQVKGRSNLFSRFRYDASIESNMLKIGILQMANGKLGFVHRTYAEYFVAKTILELCELDTCKFNQDVAFQQFLIDEILCNPQFTVIRAFLDSAFEDVLESLPPNILENYRTHVKSHPKSQKQRSQLLHLLAREGHVSILEMILKCINFKVKTAEMKNTFKGNKKNTLNLLRVLVGKYGIDIKEKFGNTPLHSATDGGHLTTVQFLVQHGANIHCRNSKGESAVHVAASRGHLKVIQFLLEHDDDMTPENDRGYTALHLAAQGGHLDICKLLRERGADVNLHSKHGDNALNLASLGGHLDVVKFLSEYTQLSPNNNGLTALHFAAAKGHLEVCRHLIETRVGVNVNNEVGCSALYIACLTGHLDVVKYLIEHAHADLVENDGVSALHGAAQGDHLEICQFLVERGIDVNLCDKDRFTALHMASSKGHSRVVRFLIDNNANDAPNNAGFTALHLAASEGRLNVCKLLIEKGADINIRNEDGFSALHLASVKGFAGVVKLLVDYGHGDINDASNSGFPSLHLAAYEGHLDVCKLFLERGLSVNLCDKIGNTALHLASGKGHWEIVKFLVESAQADVNVASHDGDTALHYAATAGRLDVCRFLLERGADVHLRNKKGITALHLAVLQGHFDVVEILRQALASVATLP